MNQVGIRIKKIRENHGIRQDFIAIEMGLTQSAYSKLEKNDKRLNVEKLVKIADILKVQVSVLFGEEVKSIDDEIKEKQIQAQIEALVQYNKSLREEIIFLKEEVVFLRKMLSGSH